MRRTILSRYGCFWLPLKSEQIRCFSFVQQRWRAWYLERLTKTRITTPVAEEPIPLVLK